MARSRLSLSAENAILRHQLAVLQRGRTRTVLRPADRVLWIWLSRHWSRWRQALVLIQPATVLKWHRAGYRCYWRRRSGGPGSRPRIPRTHINLIRRISSDHPEWGEDRIALELKAKLGVVHPPSTVRRYMITWKESGAPASTTWRTFLAGHAAELWTMDLSTLAWVKQKIREATPFGSAPRFLVHDSESSASSAHVGRARREDRTAVLWICG